MKTRAKLEALKLEKFRALVRHANDRAPYYANIIRQRSINAETCVPSDFPVLTKSILMAHFDDIVTDRRVTRQIVSDFLARSNEPRERLFNDLTVMHTSGTSGEVGYFLYAPSDYRRMYAGRRRNGSALREFLRRRKNRFRRVRLAFYGATGGHYAGVTAMAALQRGLLRLLVRTATFEVNTALPKVVSGLNAFQPEVLVGYTTALRMLAQEQHAGRLEIAPLAVMASGEVTTGADLAALSGGFGGARALNIYACTEHMNLGISNPDGDTMTLTDDNLIFEIHDDHTLITNLFNFTMPLIRYRMSDILQQVSPPDARRIVIRNLVGRSEQMPTFRNSTGAVDFLSPHTINEIFVKGVTRFQMQLTGPASFRFPFCVEPGLDMQERAAATAGVQSRLTEILLQKGLDNVTFEAPLVDEIALNPRTRKFQLIIDERTEACSMGTP